MSWGTVAVVVAFIVGAVVAGALGDHALSVSLASAAAALALPSNRGPQGPDGAPAGEVTSTIKRALPAVAALVGYGAMQLAADHGPALAVLFHKG